MTRIVLVALLLTSGCTSNPESAPAAGDYLYVWAWASDTSRGSLLATFDLGQNPPTMASVVFADSPSRGAHHIEHDVGPDSLIFANAFGAGRTFVFDLRAPGQPRVKASLGDAGPFSHPHSYMRLPNGNRLATFQWKVGGGLPGGLVELDTAGTPVRWSSAAPKSADSLQIVPYSLAILPELDRVVSTSTHMIENVGVHMQIWRLSDLALLQTIPVPLASPSHAHAGHDSTHHQYPGEPRVLADGRTVMFGTFTCGLYHITDLAQNPKIVFSAAFPGANCAVPVVVGKYWIQTVPASNALVALDVSDPAKPRETSRLIFAPEVHPHWLGVDPTGQRLAVSSADKDDPVIRLVHFDPQTGMLSSSADAVVLTLKDVAWPDGFRGDAVPHGIVFGRR